MQTVPSYGSEHFWYLWKHDNDSRYVSFREKYCAPNFQYQDFAPMFNSELWDPVNWANLFINKQSGARYSYRAALESFVVMHLSV